MALEWPTSSVASYFLERNTTRRKPEYWKADGDQDQTLHSVGAVAQNRSYQKGN
jgi:hypothetical protein